MALYDEVILYLSNTLTDRQFTSSASTGTPMRYTCTSQQMVEVPLSRDKLVVAKTLEVVKNGHEAVDLFLWYRQTQIRPEQSTSSVFNVSPKKLSLGKCSNMQSFLTQFLAKILDYMVGETPRLVEVMRCMLGRFPKHTVPDRPISTQLPVGPRIMHRATRGKYLTPRVSQPVVVREILITDQREQNRQWHNMNPIERALSGIPASYTFTLVTAGDSTGLLIGEAPTRNVKNSALFWLGVESAGGYSYSMVINDGRNSSNGSDNRTKVLSGVSSYAIEQEIAECLHERIFQYSDSMRKLRLPLLFSSARLF